MGQRNASGAALRLSTKVTTAPLPLRPISLSLSLPFSKLICVAGVARWPRPRHVKAETRMVTLDVAEQTLNPKP